VKFLKNENLVKSEVPESPENHTMHDKRVWLYCRGGLMNTRWEPVLFVYCTDVTLWLWY